MGGQRFIWGLHGTKYTAVRVGYSTGERNDQPREDWEIG